MSRYEFTGNKTNLRIVVGWDRPLQTFFAQVWDGGELEEGNLLLWVGAGPPPVETLKELAELLAPFGVIPDQVAAKLQEDFREECKKLAPFHLLFGR
jgi:hypothetical protein